ncbi:16S rRNA (guanine(966)-N(2))-methyltransferase RsmD, partial [Stenotrophomonas maltophilia]|nr:16S rRNA (guanine(966)-N(2))-methyltransferase RsmD [Stenotrophomonas maltophilia]
MDAATELTWTYLQRPPQPDPPRHPTGNPVLPLLLLLPLPWLEASAG